MLAGGLKMLRELTFMKINYDGNSSENIVAAIQMCSSHLIDDNINIAKQLISKAASNNAKLVVLPEMFAIMGLNPKDKILAKEKFGFGKIQDFLSEQSRKNKIWIVGGTIPIESENNEKVRASSLIFNEEGSFVARYDKIHLFDMLVSEKEAYKESDTTEPGSELIVVDTPVGRLGLGICYDIRFPEMFRDLYSKKVEIIAIPSAFTVTTGKAHWEILAKSRAVENFCYVIGSCQGGTHSSGRKTYGNSIIIAPWGNIVAKKKGVGAGVIYAGIDLGKVGKLMCC